MTYLELIERAERLLDKNKITLGEWDRMIEPLRRPILPDFIKNSRWIPVTEEMPEKYSTVLITIKTRYSDSEQWEYYTDVAGYYGYGWTMFNDWDEGQECYIAAWMPLPQPWKGADDE